MIQYRLTYCDYLNRIIEGYIIAHNYVDALKIAINMQGVTEIIDLVPFEAGGKSK